MFLELSRFKLEVNTKISRKCSIIFVYLFLSIPVKCMLWSLTTIKDLSISPLSSVNSYIMNLKLYLTCAYLKLWYLLEWFFYQYEISFSSPVKLLVPFFLFFCFMFLLPFSIFVFYLATSSLSCGTQDLYLQCANS